MELKTIHEVTFDMEHTILAACLYNRDEWVMLLSDRRVLRFNTRDRCFSELFSMNFNGGSRDSGFDINTASSIYVMDDIVTVVNDYKTHGWVYYPEKDHSVHLWRKDYHTAHSKFPVALFKNESSIPHLIYGEDWNHVQIMNLDTLQILTAGKSLIEEGAEERFAAYYKDAAKPNKHPWPMPYDYFYGGLLMSPDNKHFMSTGWVWGSIDVYGIYNVEHFIKNNRIKHQSIGFGEHKNRPACWVSHNIVAVPYSPFIDGDEESPDAPVELHFYDIQSEEFLASRKILFEHLDGLEGSLHYSKNLDAFMAFTQAKGLFACSLEGEVLFKDESFKPDTFNNELDLFIRIDGKTITVHQLLMPT